jgi:hypothetical protein
VHEALRDLAAIPAVAQAAQAARDACSLLRWHQALRRRIPEAAAESRVRGAQASAALDGADLPLEMVRELVVGVRDLSGDHDPVALVVSGAVRATVESEHLAPLVARSPLQALARLHMAAATGLLPTDQLGRPRAEGEVCAEGRDLGPAPTAAEVAERLSGLAAVLQAPADIPALVVAAVAHGEVMAMRPFVSGNAVVARALERAVFLSRGLDPTGVAVPELGHRRVAGDLAYRAGLGGYTSGTPAGVTAWLLRCGDAAVAAAAAGSEVADAVLSGRLS